MAAYSVVVVLSLVAVAIYTGLSQGVQPVISRSHGLRNTEAVKSLLRYGLITMLLLSGIIYCVIFFCASPITSVFNSEQNEAMQAMAVTGLKMYFTACPFVGFNIVLAIYFTSTERPYPAHIISLLRGFFVIIPAAFLLSSLVGMTGVWCAFPVTECVVAAVGVLFYMKGRKRSEMR